jgi:hypothetical protein
MNRHYLCKDILCEIGKYLTREEVIKFDFYEAFIQRELYYEQDLIIAAKYGRLNMIEWIYKNIENQISKILKIEKLFNKFFKVRYNFTPKAAWWTGKETLKIFSGCGNLNAIKIVYSHFKSKFKYDDEKEKQKIIIRYAIKNNRINIIKWLKSEQLFYDTYALLKAAKYGNFAVIKLIYKEKTYDESFNNNIVIAVINDYPEKKYISKCDSLKIIKWLYKKGCIYESAINDAAVNGKLNIVKWLHKKGYNCLNGIYDAILYGHLDVAEWFYNNTKFKLCNFNILKEVVIFRETAKLKAVKWLYDHNIKFETGYVLNYCSDPEIFKYLYEKGVRENLQEGLELLLEKGEIETVEWILLKEIAAKEELD